MQRFFLSAALAVSLVATGVHAQDTRTLAAGAAPAPATLDALNGIVGNWKTGLGATGFSPPVGGEIVGHVALTDDKGAPRVHELWIFRPEGGSIVLRQKIVNGDLTDREDKDKFEVRKLVAVQGGALYFENMTITPKGDAMTVVVNRPAGVLVNNYTRIK